MSSLRLALKDLLDNRIYVVVYSFVMSVIVVILYLLSISFIENYKSYKILQNLISQERYYVYTYYKEEGGIYIESLPEEFILPENFDNNTTSGVIGQLDILFKHQELAGSFIITNIKGKDFVILLGNYSQLMGINYDLSNNKTLALLPYGSSNKDSIEICDTKIQVEDTLVKNQKIYHPLKGQINISEYYVIISDLSTWKTIYPIIETEQILSNLILTNPSQLQIDRLILSTYNSGPIVAKLQAIKYYFDEVSVPIIYEHSSFFIFFIFSSLTIILGCIANMCNLVNKKALEYAVHHLYGATPLQLSMRIVLFSIISNLIPLLASWFILFINQGKRFEYLLFILIFIIYNAITILYPLHILLTDNKILSIRRND